jgi:phage-related baseplate assembly protein
MAGSFTAVDLSKLPAPPVLESIDPQSMFNQMLARLQFLDPQFTALVPSDPIWKILEVVTYFRMLDRQRVNDGAKSVMLAYAIDGNLDHLGALVGVERNLLDEGDPENNIPRTMETNEDYRRRIQLAPEGFSVAGPEGAYTFHALSADPRVLDASATSPEPNDIRNLVLDTLTVLGVEPSVIAGMTAALDSATWPGEVRVSILSRELDGTASPGLISAVTAKLAANDVRPMTDHVTVQSAEIISYIIEAVVYTFAGPDAAVVMAEANSRLRAYIAESHRLGRDVTRSALYAALHCPGVQRVVLIEPASDIVVDRAAAPHCTAIDVTHGGVGE